MNEMFDFHDQEIQWVIFINILFCFVRQTHSFLSSNCLFCLAQSPKPQIIISHKEKQLILPFEKLKSENVWHFCLINDSQDWLSKTLMINVAFV